MSDQQKADFQPVEAPESLRLLHEGAKTLSSTIMWTKDQEDQIHTHLCMISEVEDSFLCWLPKDFDASGFSEKIAERGEVDIFFSVSLPGANIFFKTNFIGYDETSLKFGIPSRIFKVQRRQNLRFAIPDGRILKLQFADPLGTGKKLHYKIHDISAGGLAFIVEPGEELLFKKGEILRELSFVINARTLTIDGQIMHTSPTPSTYKTQGIKIGTQFLNIKTTDSQHIATFVFDESRKFFAKFF